MAGGDVIEQAVRQHVANMVAELRNKPVIKSAIEAGTLQVIGGR